MAGIGGGGGSSVVPPVTPFTATGPTTFTSPPQPQPQQQQNNISTSRPSIASQDSTLLSSLSISKTSTATPQPPAAGAAAAPPPPPAGSSQLRLPFNRKTIYDRNLNRSRNAELSRSAFAFLFMEIVAYAHRRVTGIQDFERRLNEQGYLLGSKCLDLLVYRMTPAGSGGGGSGGSSSGSGSNGSGSGLSSSSSSSSTGGPALALRPVRLLPLLNLLMTKLYPLLFARAADSLEQSTTEAREYMIIDNAPLTNAYISVPRELSQLSVAAYTAGVIEGVCDAAGFEARVSSHNQGTDAAPTRTVFLLRFADAVIEREKELDRMGVK